MADRFNFCSAAFDPLAALLAADVCPPVQDARPLDNLHKCRWLLLEGHPDALRDQHVARSKESAAARERAKLRLSYVAHKKEQQSWQADPLEQVAAAVREGPLLLLRACMQSRRSVRVVTRHAAGVRGAATGVLVAYDKYCNLILRDVEEHYTVLRRVQRETGPGKTRWGRKQERRTRRLKQVFVRGESVVLVAAAPPAAGPVAP